MDRCLKLSIIVPVYNVEKYLKECVDSLFQQDLPEEAYEVILINDGSTDGSYELAQELAAAHSNIVLLTQENQGLSVARNSGLDVAQGKYVMFVDSDDKLFPNVLERILSAAEHNRLDVCAYRIKYVDEYGQLHNGSVQPFPPDRIYDGRYAVTHGADIGGVWLNLYLRDMLEEHSLRFLPGIYHEDVDFNLRMYAYADKMMFTDIVAYYYRYVPGSLSRKPNKEKTIKLISDEIVIVRHIRDFSENDESGRTLKTFYERHGNSMLISVLLGLRNQHKLSFKEKKAIISKMKGHGLYPIKGRTLSWNTMLIKNLVNIELFLYRYIIS